MKSRDFKGPSSDGDGDGDGDGAPLIVHSLRGDGFDASEDGTGRGTPLVPVAFSATDYKTQRFDEVEVSRPLTTSPDRSRAAPLVTLTPIDMRQASRGDKLTNNRASGSGGPPGHGVGDAGDPAFTVSERGQAVAGTSAVRRLTPRECERLKGFPDDWTLVPHRGKPAADGPRYKAIGNSMAVPVMAWIGRRIAFVHSIG